MKLKISLILFIFVSVCSNGFGQQQSNKTFEEANIAYRNENYEKAAELYNELAREYESFELYFNMGNTYYRLDSLGKAILYYERAKEINSSDEDLEVNLRIAQQQVIDKIEALPSLGVLTIWNRLTSASLLTTYAIVSLIFLFLSVLALGGRLVSRKSSTQQLTTILATVLFLGFAVVFSLGLATTNEIKDDQEAIVMVEEVLVKSSPKENSTVVFEIHEGTKVKVERLEHGWTEIKLANGSVGWIPEKAIERI